MKTKPSAYEIIDIPKNCTIDELKQKFKSLAVKYHPDKGGDKYIFNLVVESFKSIHKDIKDRESDKSFVDLKTEALYKQSDVNTFVKANGDFHDKFNTFFNSNKTIDENSERGYNKFINEQDIKTKETHYKIRKYKEPEGSVLSKLQYEELGQKITDFSGKNDSMHSLQYMDYQYAHTTSKLIDHDMVEDRQDFKDFNDIKQKREAVNFELTDHDKNYYDKIKSNISKKETKRLSNLEKQNNYLEKHNQSISKLVL